MDELRRRLQDVGPPVTVEGRSLTRHSFRRVAATWAARAGIPDTNIRLLGRWSLGFIKERSYRYIDIGMGEIAALARKLYRDLTNDGRDDTEGQFDNANDPWNDLSDDDTHR